MTTKDEPKVQIVIKDLEPDHFMVNVCFGIGGNDGGFDGRSAEADFMMPKQDLASYPEFRARCIAKAKQILIEAAR